MTDYWIKGSSGVIRPVLAAGGTGDPVLPVIPAHWINGSSGVQRPGDVPTGVGATIDSTGAFDNTIYADGDPGAVGAYRPYDGASVIVSLPNVQSDQGGFTGMTANALVVPRTARCLVVAVFMLTGERSFFPGLAADGEIDVFVEATAAGVVVPFSYMFDSHDFFTPRLPSDLSFAAAAVGTLSAGTTLRLRCANTWALTVGGGFTGHSASLNLATLGIAEVPASFVWPPT